MSADSESRLDAEFEAAISRGVFSGASLLVSGGRTPDFERTWGTVESGGVPVTPSTRFDLASLTKPLVTAPLCMVAVERGVMNLEDSLSRFFPGSVPADKEGITVKSLLSHSSGLPPYEPFYLELIKLPPKARRDALASMILRTPLDNPPGRAANYSDLGFMLLGLILEQQLGDRLDTLARNFLFSPLGIEELHFCPTLEVSAGKAHLAERRDRFIAGKAHLAERRDRFIAGKARSYRVLSYAATQLCPWRKRLLFGEVDDENAWTMNGVAGHAGLFGTARGVFDLLSFLWKTYEGDGTDPRWPPDMVRLFWTRTEVAEGSSDWCLGYDTPSRKGFSTSGRHFSQRTIGHLGFTGVSFWLDLEKGILVVLLTNRVHPTRQNDEIRQLRPILHDMIMEGIIRHSGSGRQREQGD